MQRPVPTPPTRRAVMGGAAARVAAGPEAGPGPAPGLVPFDAGEFATVGVYGLDWLLDPRFTRMLDMLAASPGAVRGVRVFGALSLGRDRVAPLTSAGVWDGPGPPDFSRTLAALETLTKRGLVPFLPLTFFPPRVSPAPAQPPADWDAWTTLVRAFLDAVVQRFGAAEVGRWWFEVWNEPNMPPFWAGTFDRYLDLYRATAEAVARSGHRVRLGGPVVAYLPGEGPPLMERFLRFLADAPGLQCDFVSLHRKGAWTNEEGEPDLQRLHQAAVDTADAVLRLVPGRARGMVVVNNEADMLVGFDRPYPPRMTHQSVAWLAAITVMHDKLSVQYAKHGIRFRALSDNANQHLTQGPFDGRRTLMTPLADRMDDLVKLPVYGFYELLRLMGPRRVATGGAVPPGVSYVCTEGPAGRAALFSHYGSREHRFSYQMPGRVPGAGRSVNVVQFCVDVTRTGARPGLDPMAMRRAAELAVVRPIRRDVAPGAEPIVLGPYGTVLLWVTPHALRPLPVPEWLQARPDGPNTLLRWTPCTAPHFYSYEVRRDGVVITPEPLRAAFWIDDAAGYELAGRRRYEVRSVSVSGNASSWATALVNL